jgi:hypothetical protein
MINKSVLQVSTTIGIFGSRTETSLVGGRNVSGKKDEMQESVDNY